MGVPRSRQAINASDAASLAKRAQWRRGHDRQVFVEKIKTLTKGEPVIAAGTERGRVVDTDKKTLTVRVELRPGRVLPFHVKVVEKDPSSQAQR